MILVYMFSFQVGIHYDIDFLKLNLSESYSVSEFSIAIDL